MDTRLYFLKFNRINSPKETINNAKRVIWQYRKYSKWNDVHVSENSHDLLLKISDDLENEFLDPDNYQELIEILIKVQSWAQTKNDDVSFDLLPSIRKEYEVLDRAIKNGSQRPGLVDQIIVNNNFDLDKISIKDRWWLFVSIEINKFFTSNKRFSKDYPDIFTETNNNKNDYLKTTMVFLKTIIGEYYFSKKDLKDNSPENLFEKFLSGLSLPIKPEITDRSNVVIASTSEKVIIEEIKTTKTIFVKFEYVNSQIIIKKNINHIAFKDKKDIFINFQSDQFWKLIGETLFSKVGQIDQIQSFFDLLGLNLNDQ